MTVSVSATASDRLGDLAERYWEHRLTTSPLFATFLGDHRFDDRADNLSEAAEADQRAHLVAFLHEARALDPDDLEASVLDDGDRTTLDLLVGELEESIVAVDARLVELMSDQMQGVHADLLTMAGQLAVPSAELAPAALTRIGALATMLDQATTRFRAGLDRGRTPARINVERSLNQLDGYLASPLDTDPFATIAAPTQQQDGWDGEAAWRAAMTDAVAAVLRPAFARSRRA